MYMGESREISCISVEVGFAEGIKRKKRERRSDAGTG